MLVAVCVVIIVLALIVKSLHLGLKKRIAKAGLDEYAKLEYRLDASPPTAPFELTGGASPAIIYSEHYLSRMQLKRHVAPVFNSTGGDLIIIAASSHNNTILSPTDNYQNHWMSLAGPTNSTAGANLRSQIWYAKNPKVGPNHALTVRLSTGQALVISIFVIKGASSNPIDEASAIQDDAGASTAYPESPDIKTAAANDLLIAFGKSSVSEEWQAGDGFKLQRWASSDYLAAESGLAANPGIYKPSFSISSPSTWQAFVVAIRPAANPSNKSPIRLSWHASSDNVGVLEYEIQRCTGRSCTDFSKIGASSDTSFVDSSPPQSEIYSYRVRSVDHSSNFSDFSNIVTVEAKGRHHRGASASVQAEDGTSRKL